VSVAFRAAANVLNATAVANITVSRPTGTDNGDYLVAFIARVAGAAPTPPAGWAALGTAAINGTAVTLAAFGKLASSEPSSWTWTASSAISWGWVGAYTGVDRNLPVSTSNTNTLGAGTAYFAHSATLLRGGVALGVWATTRTASGAATTWTPGTPTVGAATERLDTSSNNGAGTDLAGEVVEVPSVGADTLETIFGTASQSQTAGAAWMVMLNPYFALPHPGTVVPVVVEAAFGADLTADESTWVWTDISNRFLGTIDDPAQITRGQADETQQTQPSQGSGIRLSNVDGWLTPRNPSSLWYLLWGVEGQDTPLRISQQYPLGPYVRLQGNVTSIGPTWPSGHESWSEVDVMVAGRLGALQDVGSAAFSPLKYGLGRSIIPAGALPVLYYPFEEGSGATYTTEFSSTLPLTPAGPINWGASSALAASAPLPTIPAGSSVIIGIGTSLASSWRFDFVFSVPTTVATQSAVIQWSMFGGATAPKWRLLVTPGTPPVMKLQAFTPAGVEQFGDTGIPLQQLNGVAIPTGAPIFCTVQAHTNGVSVDWSHSYSYPGGFGGTVASSGNKNPMTLGIPLRAFLMPDAVMDGMIFGHFAYIQPSDWTGTSFANGDFVYADANDGESATSRISRLCQENNIPLTLTGSSHQTMGPQILDSIHGLLRAAEEVDGGILCDGRSSGLTFLPLSARQNAAVVMALDCKLRQVKWRDAGSFAPVEDDQRAADDVTASRPGGSSVRATTLVDKTRAGRHQKTLNPAVQTDDQLLSQASWRLTLGQVPEMRTPVIEIDLRDNPELLQQWLRMDIGSRYTVANPPAQYPVGGLDLILESYVERIAGDSHTVTLTGFPFAPFRSYVVGDPLLGRVAGSGGSYVAHVGTGDVIGDPLGISATDTSFTFAGSTWVDNATYPADFPFDVDIEGEQCRVTASTGSTLTITRSINGVVKSHPVGTLVKLWRPAGIAL
jgi:hypothetical protein